jgi:DnaJ-class molecular chaperone
MAEDYYKTLGVSREASADEIQAAYRKLARKYHPDLNQDDASAKQKFQEVQAAFDVLNDASKRELYDRYGASFDSMGAGGGPRTGAGPWSSGAGGGWSGGSWGGGAPQDFDFSEIFGGGGGGGESSFGDIFGQFRRASDSGRRAKATPKRGADVEAEITIPFNTAVVGGETEIELRGDGGSTKRVSVKIPAGIDEGKKIRLRGQGGPARRGGAAGDLLITVHVAAHPFFVRRGNDLTVTVPVTLAEAALGAKVDVPTPKGTISLRVPPGTSSGTRLRAKGRGVAPVNGDPGDLYADVEIVIPRNLDERSQELVRELDQHFSTLDATSPRESLQW